MNKKDVNTATRIETLIRSRYGDFTGSEKSMASFILENLQTISFETGAAIATKINVSEMTVIRFVRNLGYSNLRELKDELRQETLDGDFDLDDILGRFQVQRDDLNYLKESMDLEMRAVAKAFEEVTTPQWQPIVELLSSIETINIVGFQATKGVAMDFSSRLKYARNGVFFAEGLTGTYSEILEADPEKSCLFIVDTASYSRKGLLLAKKAKALGIPMIIVTDKYSHWALEFTDYVLAGHTLVQTFWDSTASLSIILNLLINAVASLLGKHAEERFERLRALGQDFDEFSQTHCGKDKLSKANKKPRRK
jgi:DNA-binding MurR/RpiR family transcriptional regulator